MSDNEIEKLKLQIQREQAARDFWKWFIMYILVALGPFINLATAYLEHRAIGSVAQKAEVIEKKAGVAAQAAVSTNVITTQWQAGRTGDPDDMAKAEEAAAKAQAVEKMP